MKEPYTAAPTVTCFATPELKVSLRPLTFLPSPPLLLRGFKQSPISSSASVEASRQSAGRGTRLQARTTVGFSVADVTWGEEQAVRKPPSGTKICELINLAPLEGQPLLCVERGFGVSVCSVGSLSLRVLDADLNKRISIRAKRMPRKT